MTADSQVFVTVCQKGENIFYRSAYVFKLKFHMQKRN